MISSPILRTLARASLPLSGLVVFAGCGDRSAGAAAGSSEEGARRPAPVEVSAIVRGPITQRRVFSGTLEASAEVMIAPRIAGHLERLTVDIGDTVERGQVIAWIEDDELVQAVAQADADLAVANATRDEAEASAQLAKRALDRQTQLRTEGIASESELDSAQATASVRKALVAVAEARVLRAAASLETARVRLKQTRIVADWEAPTAEPAGPEPVADDAHAAPPATRVVAERYVDEGTIVNASTPVVSIVALEPIVAVVFVPERDYSRLAIGQRAALATDAYAGETFSGRVARIAPVFRRATRQVRVELEIENGDRRLKPGMFVRATLELAHEDDATIVPYAALTKRGETAGVFVVPPGGAAVRWTPVEAGLREGDRVQIVGSGLVGRVVTLGQELCDDGSTISTPDSATSSGAAR